MKKTILIIITAILLINSAPLKAEAKRSGQDTIYPQTFIVYDIDSKNDLVYLQTFSGMVYTWQGIEDWMIGDVAAAIMNNNGTPDSITDDQIIVLEYSGYIY